MISEITKLLTENLLATQKVIAEPHYSLLCLKNHFLRNDYPVEIIPIIVGFMNWIPKFDSSHHNPIMQLSEDDRVCVYHEKPEFWEFASMFLRLSQPLFIKPLTHTQSFKFKFLILKARHWVACGFVEYETLRQRKEVSYSSIGHGFYCFASNGCQWRTDETPHLTTGCNFTTDDEIICAYDGPNTIITLQVIRKAEKSPLPTTSKSFTSITKIDNYGKLLVPVILMFNVGESVKLLDAYR